MKLTLQIKQNESTDISKNKTIETITLIISELSCQNGINTSHEMNVPIGI